MADTHIIDLQILSNSSNVNRRLMLSFMLFEVYLLITVASMTDSMLLVPSTVKLPLVNIDIPLFAFCIIAPLFSIALHFNLLVHLQQHIRKVRKFLRQEGNSIQNNDLNLSPFLFNYLEQFQRGHLQHHLLLLVLNVIVVLFPATVLLYIQFKFSKYQSLTMTGWHYGVLLIELYVVRLYWPRIVVHDQVRDEKETWQSLFDLEKRVILRPLLKTIMPGLTLGSFLILVHVFSSKWLANCIILIELVMLISFVFVVLLRYKRLPELGLLKAFWLVLWQTLLLVALWEWLCKVVWFLATSSKYIFHKLIGTNIDESNKPSHRRVGNLQGFLSIFLVIAATLNFLIILALPIINNQDSLMSVAGIFKIKCPRIVVRGQLLVAEQPSDTIIQPYVAKGKIKEKDWMPFYEGLNLKNRCLKFADLRNNRLFKVNFVKAKLQGADLKKADLQGANLHEAELQGADLFDANLQDTDLREANLQGADLRQADLQGTKSLMWVNLQDANLRQAKLQGTDLRQANLQGINLVKADLQSADLSLANLQNANLEKANLQDADLRNTNLQGADLEKADLQGAKLNEAKLQGADLFGANLQDTDLGKANLQGADLRNTNRQGADLEKADLQGADVGKISNPYDLITDDKLQSSWYSIESFWASGKAGSFKGVDDIEIKYMLFKQSKEKEVGAIVISIGRAETYIKYKELIYNLGKSGYTVYIHDHRGQGYSGRMTKDPQKCYVKDFNDYVTDLKTFYDSKVDPNKHQNLYLLAHSMGAIIATLYIEKYQYDFRAAALSSPMHQISTNIGQTISLKLINFSARILNFFVSMFGWDPRYVLGRGPYEKKIFEDNNRNMMTHSQQRFEAIQNLYERNPQVKVGGITSHWLLKVSEASEKLLANAASVKIPVLVIQAEDGFGFTETGQRTFCNNLAASGGKIKCEGGKPFVILSGYHELFIESDKYRIPAITKIIKFFEKYSFTMN